MMNSQSNKAITSVFWATVLTVIVGMALARAEMPKGEYLEGKGSGAKVAVLLAHGRGGSPDGNVVGSLRKSLNQELGVQTLTPYLPEPRVDSPESPAFAAVFPEAERIIQSGIDFLRKEKGAARVYVVGYSLGGRVVCAYLAEHANAGVAGFIGVGLLGGGPVPVNTNLTLEKVNVPVIDIYAENDRDAKFAQYRKRYLSDRYVQVPIPGATHDYRGYEKPVADAVIDWLKTQEAKASTR